MAISYVGGQVAGRANPSSALSVNFALTGGSNSVPSADDLVIVTCVTGSAAGNPAMAVTTPTGYTALGQLNQSAQTNDTSLNVSYKVMTSTPDTAVTIPGTANNAFGEAYSIQVFRGVSTSTPMDATAVSAGGTGTGRPDPAAITPVTAGAWVVICGGGAAGTGANYTAPANYTTNFLTASGADTTDAMVGSGYWTGWTSGAENPGAYTGGTTNAANSWSAYTLALRPTPAAQSLTPGLFSNSQSFYAPTVSAGPVALTPGLFSNSAAFYAPTISPGAVALSPGLYSNSETFYSPTVEQPSGAQNLAPARHDNAQTFYAPTVAAGPVNLTPELVSNAQTFYAATVTTGAVGLAPELLTNSSSFYAATVTPGAVALAPTLATNTAAFYAATVAPGAVGLSPTLFSGANNFYSPTVTPGAVNLAPSLLTDGETFYAATVSDGGAQALNASLVTNSAQFFGPTVEGGAQSVDTPSYGGGGRNTRLANDTHRQRLRAHRAQQITEQNQAIIMTIMQAIAAGAIE